MTNRPFTPAAIIQIATDNRHPRPRGRPRPASERGTGTGDGL
jgi:hypothetical protein